MEWSTSSFCRSCQLVARWLRASEVKRLALSNRDCWSSLRQGLRWRFAALAMDGDNKYHPGRVLERVATDEVGYLHVSNYGALLFREIANCSFQKLSRLEVADCLFESVGAETVARLLSLQHLRELSLIRCCLKQSDVDRLAASASSLSSLCIAESRLSFVTLGPALDNWLGSGNHGLLELTLHGRFRIDESLAAAIARCRQLKALRLQHNFRLTDEMMQLLCSALTSHSDAAQLEILDVSMVGGGGLTDLTGLMVGAAMESGDLCLSEVNFAGHRMSAAALERCLSGGSIKLRHLNFTANKLGAGTGDFDLASAATGAHGLRTLRLGGGNDSYGEYDFDDDEPAYGTAPRALASLSWLTALPALTFLDVSGANLDDEAFVGLGVALASSALAASLVHLDLSRNLLTDDGIGPLLDGLLRGRASVLRLDLSINGIGDEGCSAVGNALRPGAALASLKRLSIRGNAIARIGEICGNLALSPLCELDLRENLLGDSDAQRLLLAISARQRRSENFHAGDLMVHWSGNEFSEEMASKLGVAETRCEIQEERVSCPHWLFADAPTLMTAARAQEHMVTEEISATQDRTVSAPDPTEFQRTIFAGSSEVAPIRGARLEASSGAHGAQFNKVLRADGRVPGNEIIRADCSGTDTPFLQAPVGFDRRGGTSPTLPHSHGDATLRLPPPISADDPAAQALHSAGQSHSVPRSASVEEDSSDAAIDMQNDGLPAITAAEWQDCVDSIKWMESCIRTAEQ